MHKQNGVAGEHHDTLETTHPLLIYASMPKNSFVGAMITSANLIYCGPTVMSGILPHGHLYSATLLMVISKYLGVLTCCFTLISMTNYPLNYFVVCQTYSLEHKVQVCGRFNHVTHQLRNRKINQSHNIKVTRILCFKPN